MTLFIKDNFLVADSTNKQAGLGLFSEVNIRPGDTIGHYTGQVFTDEEIDQSPYLESDYIFWVCTDHNIVGEGELANYTRYINHSNKPNSQFIVSTRWKTARVEAILPIKPGEEIFIDYGPDYWEAKGIKMDVKENIKVNKIYIAGPDVFEENSIEIGQKYSSLCEKYGFKGLYPLDNRINTDQEKQKIAYDIFNANVKQIQEADIVIANINAFRGKETDSGTSWECGFAHALGKRVYAYMDSTIPYIDSFSSVEQMTVDGMIVDREAKIIEDFNLPVNLMLACSIFEIIEGGFEDVLKKLTS